ncbi:RIP metalloprotease RseP [Pararhodobacter zhoushanensis]|uniref:Zinc metalloprotease n=1 Tax=Pararhodobacter zhoushanensis TaxID=2479545 RepID=A0ABT3GZ73_9RHOB|nr:RIP metalloprotease RseP [Pararhodobacter zhoushanensis]MCW1932775.1 RIP metalloprotease RseP [Pararhodobacter zhoushanensis]
MGLLPEFGNLFFTLAAFIVALSIIVTVHEYGHYIIGRWSGIHAEVFSLGFGPVLFSRTDKRGTQWQVAALPFGGYVKFLGDANAASAGADDEVMSHLDAKERRRTMHGAPLWARAATIFAGPAFNFIFSILIFTAFLAVQGLPDKTPRVGPLFAMPGVVELQEGDLITAIDGQPTPELTDFYRVGSEIAPAESVPYTVERDGQTLTVQGPHPIPARAAGIALNSAARDASMQTGDVVLSVNETPVWAFSQLPPLVSDGAGAPVALQVWRSGSEVDLSLTPRRTDLPLPDGGFETRWLIGLQSGTFFEHPTRSVGVVEAVPLAVAQIGEIVTNSISGLYHMITGAISTCNLSGPVGIATTSGEMASDGAASFIWFIAVLSTAVGLLNLFPIPILDGGHLVFHAYEALVGRPPNERVMGYLMSFGLVLLGAMMLFALGNDLFC